MFSSAGQAENFASWAADDESYVVTALMRGSAARDWK